MNAAVDDRCWVRVPSMFACGYEDIPGIISTVLPDSSVNVKRSDNIPIAYGQRIIHLRGGKIEYGAIV